MTREIEENFLPALTVGYALSKAGGVLMADMDEALADTGVSSSQLRTLVSLSQERARSPAQLAKLLAVDPGYLTRMIDRLEQQNLVHRTRDAVDRRVVNLGLTEGGRALVGRIEALAPELLNRRLLRLSGRECETLSRLLAKLLDD